ncbi:MAG TPA: GEVED domain-containing protein [Saprospiraceae bacterium]|nr:GEVED domain-containing protein [Saprospiraceae bacterium]
MKYCIVLLLCLLFSIHAWSQPWLELLPDKPRTELTFYDYRQAFESYWAPYQVTDGYYTENGETVKASGWKQFKRWEYMMQSRVDPVTGAFPTKTPFQIVKEYYQQHPVPRELPASDWKSLGPSTSPGGYQGIGRTNCVAFHPTDLLTVWVGAASGGLWVTHDGGSTWTCLTDKTESLGLNDIIIPSDYESSKTIYIATGDKDAFDNHSVGVLKSTDGGQTWQTTGLSFELAERKQVNRILQHPQNHDILIAATTDAVYKTSDGGVTWDEELIHEFFIDMEMHPADPDILYGSNFDGEVYVSLDGGQQWTKNLMDVTAGRTEMAVSPAQPDWLYVITATGNLKGIYKSTDRGSSFEKRMAGDTLNLLSYNYDGSGTTGQGSYDLAMAASPIDPNVLLVGGINTWRSTDGGVHWTLMTHWANGGVQVVHADKHNLRFRSNGDVWECNDGGLYVSYDQGVTWHDKTNGMAISQMYKMGTSATEKDEVITGLQDNGSKLRTALGWQNVNGGDGTDCMIDPVDYRIQYSSSQSGNIFRTLDHWTTSLYIKPQAAGAGLWVTPYALDPQQPNIIYGGFKEVWKSIDRGTSWNQVSTISASAKINSIAVAPSNSDIVYVAEAGRMWKTLTAGEPFEKVFVYDVGGWITNIAVKHDDPQTVWLSCGGFIDPGVYATTDGGETWTNISQGLPLIPVNTIVQNKQSVDEVELYAGTDLGVFYKKGDGEWMPFNTGLPNVIVTDLEFYYAPDPTLTLLRASTYGRGLWETRVLFNSTPMQFVSGTAKQPNTDLVIPGTSDAEILKLEIYTTGDLEPLKATSFTFNTNGSTNPETDILSARVYYTGTLNGFQTTTLFGHSVTKPDGTFTVEGEQVLSTGPNYFWLAYHVSQDASLGNLLDAECLSYEIGTTITPDVVAPEGSRLIELVYCNAGSTQITGEHIRKVVIGNVDVSSVKGDNGYEDNTNEIVELALGESIPISVVNSSPHTTNELLIWVDWNQDADFSEVNESVYTSGPLGITTYMTNITVPVDAKTGLARLRIRLHDTSFGSNATPCGNSYLGEVEDYTVHVVEPTTSVKDAFAFAGVIIYPNPVSDILTMEAPGIEEQVHYALYDMTGRKLASGSFSGLAELSMGNFSADMYMITFQISGRKIWKRFVKPGGG